MPLNYKNTGIPFAEAEYKFETFSNYLKYFIKQISLRYKNQNEFIDHLNDRTKHIQGIGEYDKQWVERFLQNGWNTECILNLNSTKDPELARINNQWQPIQAYYAIYSIGEALAYLINGLKAGSHKKCLSKLNCFIVNLDANPWNVMYSGQIGRKENEHKPINLPKGTKLSHNLSSVTNPMDMINKCLFVEHKKRVGDDFKRKKGEKKYRYQFDPGLTSLINFIYRLRLKSNYEEIDTFLADAPDTKIVEFGDNLRKICEYTLILFEILIIRKIGKKNFLHHVDDYLTKNNMASSLAIRKSLYEAIIN